MLDPVRLRGAAADGPASAVELLALRLYDPVSNQWAIHFATPRKGELATLGIGGVHDGRIEFYDQETCNDRQILTRFSIWS